LAGRILRPDQLLCADPVPPASIASDQHLAAHAGAASIQIPFAAERK